MKGTYSDHRISTMFLVSFVLFLLTIPGQLYEYYERNWMWYTILVVASVLIHIWWCAEMYWAGKSCYFHMLWVSGYFGICAFLMGFGVMERVDMARILLLPIFIVMFLWQRMFEIWVSGSMLGDILALLVPVVLFSISFFWGYAKRNGKSREQVKDATGQTEMK